jgi:uncharacterized membrane protein YdjX (TVP38/TMEM64 family)
VQKFDTSHIRNKKAKRINDHSPIPSTPQTNSLYRQRVVSLIVLLSLSGWAIFSFTNGGIVSKVTSLELSAEEKLDAIQDYFRAWGALSPIVYVAVVIVEVVIAPIPGMMLYLPGGVIFGGFWGGVFSLIGNVLGAGISCAIMRSITGQNATRSFFAKRSLDQYRAYIEEHGAAIIALLRVNPLTSLDLVSYAAGLTSIPVWKVMTGTLVGMTPICFAQSYLAQEIFTALPWLIWPLFALCIAFATSVVIVIARIRVGEHEPSSK